MTNYEKQITKYATKCNCRNFYESPKQTCTNLQMFLINFDFFGRSALKLGRLFRPSVLSMLFSKKKCCRLFKISFMRETLCTLVVCAYENKLLISQNIILMKSWLYF